MAQLTTVISPKQVEDWSLLLSPIVLTPAFIATFGLSLNAALLLSVILGSLGKGLIGVAQWPSSKNYENWVLLIASILGLIAVGLQASPVYATVALILGLFVKAVLSFAQKPIQIEDVVLAIAAIITAFGTIFGQAELTNIALLLGTFGKSLPGIAGVTSPTPATPSPTPATPPAATSSS